MAYFIIDLIGFILILFFLWCVWHKEELIKFEDEFIQKHENVRFVIFLVNKYIRKKAK